MPRLVLYVFLLTLAAPPAFAELEPSETSCRFYLELEAQMECVGRTDGTEYLTEFGYKYCRRFHEMKKFWKDETLARFVERTGFCLQDALAGIPQRLNICSQITDYSFDAHPGCYHRSGFCDLNAFQQLQIVKVIASSDLKNQWKRTILNGLQTIQNCMSWSISNLEASGLIN